MQNFVQPGDIIDVGLPAATNPGGVVVVGNIIGIAVAGGSEGALASVATRGVYTLPKLSSDTVTVGEHVYWNASEGYATVTATSNTLLGVALAAAASGVTEIDVRLNGSY